MASTPEGKKRSHKSSLSFLPRKTITTENRENSAIETTSDLATVYAPVNPSTAKSDRLISYGLSDLRDYYQYLEIKDSFDTEADKLPSKLFGSPLLAVINASNPALPVPYIVDDTVTWLTENVTSMDLPSLILSNQQLLPK